MSPILRTTLANLFIPSVLSALIGGLAGAFPGLCRGLVEDAVQTAALDLLRSPTALPRAWERGGPAEIRQVLVIASWRGCLRLSRSPTARREQQPEQVPELPNLDTPEDLLISAEALSRVAGLVEAAARRFGGPRREALVDALEDRLGSDDTDSAVARRHGVHRESLNHAKNWIAERLPRA